MNLYNALEQRWIVVVEVRKEEALWMWEKKEKNLHDRRRSWEWASDDSEAEQQIKGNETEFVAEQLRRSEMVKSEQHSRNGKQAISE